MSHPRARAVFLDRDGTMGGTGDHCHPDDFTLFGATPAAVKLLNDAGFKVIVFTMQTGIGRKLWSEAQFVARMEHHQAELATVGVHLDGWYWCEHEWGSDCECGKPGPGMLHAAAADHGVDLAASWVVGDNGAADMCSGRAGGCRLVLVRTGWGESSLDRMRHLWADIDPDHVADDVLAAAEHIVASSP